MTEEDGGVNTSPPFVSEAFLSCTGASEKEPKKEGGLSKRSEHVSFRELHNKLLIG